MTGYSRNEIIGKSSAMMYPTKEEFEIAGDKKYKQIANSGIGSVETRLKRKDGKIINIISTSAPLDPEDLSKGVTFTVLDITERIRAEEELIQEKYLVYSLMDTLTDHIYFKDRSSRFIRINKALAKFFGLNDPIQAAGKTDSDFFTGEHSKQAYEDEQSIIRTGKQLSIEERETHLNRPDTWASTVKLPLRDKDGNIIGTFGISRDITGRKLAEEALKESQHLFQTLSQVSPVGIFRTKPGGYTTYVNPKYLELSGLTSEEAIGYGWLKAVHPDDREQLNRGWQSDVQSQISSIAEYRFLRSDGSVVWVMGNAVPEWIDNEIIGYIGTITDITERKLTEEALAESETKYRQLVMQSPDGIFIVDLSGKFLSANRAIFDNLKYSEEELLSMKIWDIVPEQYHSLHKKRLMTILNGENTSSNAEYEVIGKDEVSHFIEVMSSPYYKGKEIIGFQGIARDITERNRAEKALRESEEKYRIIFENVQDLYYETSIDGTIIEVSPSIKVLSKDQYSREDLIGKSIYDFYSDSDERAAIISLLKERGTVSDFEVTMKNKDGSTVPCSASAKIFTDALGHPEKIIGSMHDITDRKNASDALRLSKEKAEASDRLKTDFLNNISHEVRTPLNGILGFAEIVSQLDLSEEEKKDSLAMLFESSDRLLNTITDYMDISLITSGNMSVHNKDFLPVMILRKIYNSYKSVCSNRKLKLFLEIPEQSDNLSINSDPEIFQKIMSHFLNNAVKFTEKGSIHFGFKRNEEQLEFFVKDTGIGIGSDSFNNIFDRFVKEGQESYRASEGSGLGLSIAQGMSEIIGGKIRLESELGVGSCFFLAIPLKKDAEVFLSENHTNDLRKVITGSLILVAEDDETNFYYLNALLARITGIKVLHASNGKEAIELFKANPGINLILMDIKMPVMDGFEATRQIKLINRNVPVIAITAYAMSGDEERIVTAGCDGYLSKPIIKKILLEKIAEFIKI
jgi:PAS domain S-box-containing protein